ncbi:hypothetical protein C1645_878573 [Glomus cerebriforme]|uniref:Serine-threonine/tyrosine-protein kinase catalytic domain-containing protein n=1 Tax=Glomus cerebriforme TaxID=658196 RepID=A0A397SUP5_9GLOM|nr:hypothetical protein C1645_878573 [Glomus cerebriforme]
MWELMTGRRPFWDRNHDTELIIEICDGLRPPIVTNAPKGYINLMKECWHSDPEKRPTATVAGDIMLRNHLIEGSLNPTKIIPSSDIGPVTTNNPGAIYKSRPLSGMIRSAMSTMSTRSLTSRSLISEVDKRKFEDNQIENSFNEGMIKIKIFINKKNESKLILIKLKIFSAQSIKKVKIIENENENNDYVTKEVELDIDMNLKKSNDEKYFTQEFNFDI